jgi:hypothetical protein
MSGLLSHASGSDRRLLYCSEQVYITEQWHTHLTGPFMLHRTMHRSRGLVRASCTHLPLYLHREGAEKCVLFTTSRLYHAYHVVVYNPAAVAVNFLSSSALAHLKSRIS